MVPAGGERSRVADEYRVAIIGCGARGAGRTGAARAHDHWRAYAATGRCKLVALVDIVPDNMAAFAEQYADPAAPPEQFTDYREMLAQVHPDIVSICTWPALHAPMVIAAAQAGVRAIHCEKPMAPSWAEAKAMAVALDASGTQAIFTHQRRFEPQFRTARRLVREGAIGQLRELQGACPNLFDWGTHWFDMFHFYNDESPARWLLGQIDAGEAHKVFGVPVEDQGLAWIGFANGVHGVLYAGAGRPWNEANRLVGTEGVIEVQMPVGEGKQVGVRVRANGDAEWRIPEVLPEDRPGPAGSVAAATADLLACLESGAEPELSYRKSLRATELIFATYESSRLGRRVELPLQAPDASLAATMAARQVN